jgi:hypothetical protein
MCLCICVFVCVYLSACASDGVSGVSLRISVKVYDIVCMQVCIQLHSCTHWILCVSSSTCPARQLPVCLHICHLSIYPVCWLDLPSANPSVNIYIYVNVRMKCAFFSPSVHPSIRPSVRPSIHRSVVQWNRMHLSSNIFKPRCIARMSTMARAAVFSEGKRIRVGTSALSVSRQWEAEISWGSEDWDGQVWKMAKAWRCFTRLTFIVRGWLTRLETLGWKMNCDQ